MHLFLSPHPDDVPLSCGVTLWQLVAQGERCVVYTLCDGDPPNPPPDTPLVNELHARWQADAEPMRIRRAEDDAALHILGVDEVIHGLLLDCIYRTDSDGTPLYAQNDSFKGTVHPRDPQIALLEALTLPFTEQITHLHAPAAIGTHIDHQIVRDWALKLKAQRPDVELRFYEDYPYAERAEAVDEALQVLKPLVDGLELCVQVALEAEVEVKLQALRAYESQISTFWGSIAEMDEAVTCFMRLSGRRADIDQPAERTWIAHTTTN